MNKQFINYIYIYMNNWTNDQEKILTAIQKNSFDISIAKRSRFKSLKSILHFFKIPIIVLSGLNSVFSVGLNPYIEQKTISILTCSLSLFVSIIGSVELYLSINSQMNNELELSKQFYLLSIDIYKELHLQKENRTIDGKTFLLDKFSIYQKLIEQSGMLSKSINDCLKPISINELHQIPVNENLIHSSNESNKLIENNGILSKSINDLQQIPINEKLINLSNMSKEQNNLKEIQFNENLIYSSDASNEYIV